MRENVSEPCGKLLTSEVFEEPKPCLNCGELAKRSERCIKIGGEKCASIAAPSVNEEMREVLQQYRGKHRTGPMPRCVNSTASVFGGDYRCELCKVTDAVLAKADQAPQETEKWWCFDCEKNVPRDHLKQEFDNGGMTGTCVADQAGEGGDR